MWGYPPCESFTHTAHCCSLSQRVFLFLYLFFKVSPYQILCGYSWDHYLFLTTRGIINKMSNHRHTNRSYLRVRVVCLPFVTISISSMKCLSVFAKMLPLQQKPTVRQMFLMRKNVAREAGRIQLVPRKVNALHAYIIQGGVWADCTRWQAQVGCFVVDTTFPWHL